MGKFVKQKFEMVVVEFEENQLSLKVSAKTEFINTVLPIIRIANSLPLDQVKLNFYIIDYINNDLNLTVSLD
jgi:hypothetical protein